MKRAFLLVLSVMLMAGIILSACGGAATSGSEISASASTSKINSGTRAPQSSGATSTQVTASESVAASPAQSTSLSETEAIAISMDLYENGYCPLFSFLWGSEWGGGVDWEQSFNRDDIVEDMPYYRSTVYGSRAQLEEELGKTFTSAFVQRITAEFFGGDADGYILLVERDGVLYRREPGGMGGTYELDTESITIENKSEEGWAFTMPGIGIHGRPPTKRWTFNVTNENDCWLIDTMEGVFSDGSGRHSY